MRVIRLRARRQSNARFVATRMAYASASRTCAIWLFFASLRNSSCIKSSATSSRSVSRTSRACNRSPWSASSARTSSVDSSKMGFSSTFYKKDVRAAAGATATRRLFNKRSKMRPATEQVSHLSTIRSSEPPSPAFSIGAPSPTTFNSRGVLPTTRHPSLVARSFPLSVDAHWTRTFDARRGAVGDPTSSPFPAARAWASRDSSLRCSSRAATERSRNRAFNVAVLAGAIAGRCRRTLVRYGHTSTNCDRRRGLGRGGWLR